MENRVKQHKFSSKKDVTRENRRTTNVQLRKDARDEQMTKRRNLTGDLNKSPLKEKSPLREIIKPNLNENLTFDEIEKFIQSSDQETQVKAVHALRRLLSQDKNPPVGTVIDRGLVPVLVELLRDSSNTNLQFEAAWALTNVASGTSYQTSTVINAGGIPVLISLFDSPDQQAVEQAIWALGNIAGDGAECRDMVLSNGVVPKLMQHINSDKGNGFLQNLTWMMSNLCRNKPAPNIELIYPLIEPLKALVHWNDVKIQIDASWALSYITDGKSDHIQAICDTSGLVERLIQLLATGEKSVTTPALRTLGNIITGTDDQTQFAIDNGIVKLFPNLLQSRYPNIVKETCWAISNIAAGSQSQVMILQEANIIPTIIQLLNTAEFKTQKESAYVISNMVSSAIFSNVEYITGHNAIPAMGRLLGCSDSNIVILVLEFLENIMRAADGRGSTEEYCTHIEEAGILDQIEDLQSHENQEVYEKSLRLVEMYFNNDEEDYTKDKDGLYQFRDPLVEANNNYNFQF